MQDNRYVQCQQGVEQLYSMRIELLVLVFCESNHFYSTIFNIRSSFSSWNLLLLRFTGPAYSKIDKGNLQLHCPTAPRSPHTVFTEYFTKIILKKLSVLTKKRSE